MRNKMSRVLSVLFIFIFAASFTACSGGTSNVPTAVTVGNVEVGSDIYAYYLDTVLQNSDESLKEDDAKKQAEQLCANYIKINTAFKEMKLSLSSATKSDLAIDVNNLWNIFGKYYDSIGVTKQTLTKIKESEAYREELISALYDKGGEKEISEEEQKNYFNSNYVFFKAISSYLYTTDSEGKAVALSENELNEIKNSFNSMKSQINETNTIDAVNKAYEDSNGGSAESEMPVLSTVKDSDEYPEKFFSDVSAMQNGEIQVFTYDNYIFLVRKEDGSSFYSDYAKTNLSSMAGDDFNKWLESKYADVKISADRGTENSCYNLIQRAKTH